MIGTGLAQDPAVAGSGGRLPRLGVGLVAGRLARLALSKVGS